MKVSLAVGGFPLEGGSMYKGHHQATLLNEFQWLAKTVARGKKLEIKNYHFRTSCGNLYPNLCI